MADLTRRDVIALVKHADGTASAERVDARLREINAVCARVVEHYGGNVSLASLWFRIPNPMLKSLAPRDLIRYGRLRELQDRVARER